MTQAAARVAQLLGCLIVLTTACRKHIETPVAEKAAGVSHSGDSTAPSTTLSPLPQEKLPTSAPLLAMRNLESTLSDAESRLSKKPHGVAFYTMLAGLYLAHGRIVGKPGEYDRAADLVAHAEKEAPKDPNVLIARSQVQSTFHRFNDALADLAQAEALGARGRQLDGRAGILLAMGRIDEARPIVERLVKEQPTLQMLGMQAGMLADEGRIREAEALFVEAQDHFRDISPFPVAWLWLQQGLMWQKAGRAGRARELFEASLERLPMFAPAISHLAAIEAQSGDREKAIGRLRGLIVTSDDPEYRGQLAELLRAEGKKEEADKLHDEATAAFKTLLAAHPEAFADHAARFHLAWGNEAAEALRLAEVNLRGRRTSDALGLVVEAALAAGKNERACEATDEVLPLSPRSAPAYNLAWKAYTACGRKDRADAALKTAASLAHDSPL